MAGVGGEAGDEEERAPPERPSKSARKRAAHAAQDLGEQLIELNDAQLSALALPPTLEEAVRAARHIRSRAGLARQRQYIGKLMRALDPEPIRAALAARSAADARAAERFKRVESWRARLIDEGAAALEELVRWHPQLDRAAWAQRIAAAQRERTRADGGGAAARELFRALRALLDTMP
ncbi:MAG TPA: ribosome biogenesis factor YjgA [Steroidobacteraceae bacterium]|nr:ribosome biogenesis factor YjgA [Steroidobacteraceae bacterium]